MGYKNKEFASESEIRELREKASEVDRLRSRLAEMEKSLDELRARRSGMSEGWAADCEERLATLKALQMSRLIVERSPVILFRRRAGEEAALEYVSENLQRFGYSPEEFLDGSIHFRDIVHPDDKKRVGREIEMYARDDVEEYTMVYRCLTREGDVRWVEDQTSVVRDEYGVKTHNQGVLLDITERKIAEDELRKSEEKYRRIVETTAEGFVLMDENLNISDVNNAYCRMLGYSRDELIGHTPIELVSEKYRAFLTHNRQNLLALEYRTFETDIVRKDGSLVPVLIHGNTLRDYNDKVIGHMAFVTDMTEHKKALMLAAEVQKSLLPDNKISVRGLDIAGKTVSCDEIGGDYYDFIGQEEADTGPLHIAVGDISGHGVDSALLMTTARAFLRMRASQPGTLSEIITAMNNHLVHDVSDSGRFMTLFFLMLNPFEKRLAWVRAGHDPAFLLDSEMGVWTELKGEGVALGLSEDSVYKEYLLERLRTGQIIAIGTDGVWEALNSEGEMFGKERFQAVIMNNSSKCAEDILHSVFSELNQFTKGCKAVDDITLVIIKIGRMDDLGF